VSRFVSEFEEHEDHEERVLAALAEHGAMTDGHIAGLTGHAPERIADFTAQLARRGLIEPAEPRGWRLSAAWSPLEVAAPRPPQPPAEFDARPAPPDAAPRRRS